MGSTIEVALDTAVAVATAGNEKAHTPKHIHLQTHTHTHRDRLQFNNTLLLTVTLTQVDLWCLAGKRKNHWLRKSHYQHAILCTGTYNIMSECKCSTILTFWCCWSIKMILFLSPSTRLDEHAANCPWWSMLRPRLSTWLHVSIHSFVLHRWTLWKLCEMMHLTTVCMFLNDSIKP